MTRRAKAAPLGELVAVEFFPTDMRGTATAEGVARYYRGLEYRTRLARRKIRVEGDVVECWVVTARKRRTRTS